MKVDQDVINANQDRLKTLDKKQKSFIKQKEAEIEYLRNSYDQEKAYTKAKGLENVDQERRRTQAILENTITDKNQKLEDARLQIQKTQKFLENEENKLRSSYINKADFIRSSGNKYIQDLNHQAAQSAQNSREDLKDTLTAIKLENDQVIKNTEREAINKQTQMLSQSNIKISNSKIAQDKTLRELQDEMAYQQDLTRKDHQQQLKDLKLIHDQEVTDRKLIHQNKVVTTENFNNDKMQMELKAFEEKYDHMVKEHQQVIDRLNETFTKEIDVLSRTHSDQVKLRQQKSQDNFYQNKLIEPVITEDLKNYMIAIKVPEHEKDQFVLSANKRNVKLSFYRKHFDSVKDEKGLGHTTKRTESLTQNIQVGSIVDPNKVSKKYENDTLTFTIAKA